MSKLYVYSIDPIDYWPGWYQEADYLKSVQEYDEIPGASFADEYHALKKRALAAADSAGWEGDIREGPFVAGLPSTGGEVQVLIAWKQDNNGTTFIVSPVPLEHLKADAFVAVEA